MNELKSKIYGMVEKCYGWSYGIARTKKEILDKMKIDVPETLINEIRFEIKKAKKGLNETQEIIDELQSKQDEKDDGGLKTFADSEKPIRKYDVSDRHYIFYKDKAAYRVLISTVREIFASYSKHGKDMSGEEIRQKFKLPAGIFELIKGATGLYKSSHIDDPVTLERLDEHGLEDYLEGRVEKTIEDKYINAYQRAAKNKIDRDIKKLALSKRGYDIFMEQFLEAMKKYEPIKFGKIEPQHNNETKDVFITDAHIGKKGTQGIIDRFKKLTNDLINSPEGNINITFGGDLGECFVPYGEMHPGQRLGMEDIQTADLIMLVVNVLEEMLATLYKNGKTVTFNGMLGNHDRFTDHKEFDPFRTPAVVIYKFLQRILEDTSIKINILKDKANTIKSGKIKYIFLHGDGLSDAEVKRRALQEMEDGYYIVFVSGDKHHYKQIELSEKVLRIQSPALAGPGKYDESLALSSLPGAIYFQENNDGLVDVTVKRYK